MPCLLQSCFENSSTVATSNPAPVNDLMGSLEMTKQIVHGWKPLGAQFTTKVPYLVEAICVGIQFSFATTLQPAQAKPALGQFGSVQFMRPRNSLNFQNIQLLLRTFVLRTNSINMLVTKILPVHFRAVRSLLLFYVFIFSLNNMDFTLN